jgi:oxalate decarboxylase/phosphoglucose isomerase-like protein (cupin superfamily)
VADAVLLSANKGDRFLVPPGYGHVTINSGKGELVLANLVSDGFEADYSMFANLRGACFYEMDDGRLLRNQNYGSGFEMRQENAVKFSSQFGVYAPFAKKSLLEAAKKYADIEFLAKPETFY